MTNAEHRYEVVIYWSEPDGVFVAEVPELAGCMADGDTHADALRNVEPVIVEWIETDRSLGREIPKPKGRLLHA
jgi:predicted RNase H-like HicB family nuclease